VEAAPLCWSSPHSAGLSCGGRLSAEEFHGAADKVVRPSADCYGIGIRRDLRRAEVESRHLQNSYTGPTPASIGSDGFCFYRSDCMAKDNQIKLPRPVLGDIRRATECDLRIRASEYFC
jgi:hypothetical protein